LRNSLWNLSGVALPSIVALATVPVMIHGLGLEGFGVVTLIASVIGYFGLLDVNLSAGAIKYLSQYHTQRDNSRFAQTFWFGAVFYGALGLAGGLAIYAAAPLVLDHVFSVSAAARADTLLALQVAALGFFLSQRRRCSATTARRRARSCSASSATSLPLPQPPPARALPASSARVSRSMR